MSTGRFCINRLSLSLSSILQSASLQDPILSSYLPESTCAGSLFAFRAADACRRYLRGVYQPAFEARLQESKLRSDPRPLIQAQAQM